MWHDAVRAFWGVREAQTAKQVASGVVDAGTRGSVTAGKHLAPLEIAVANLFLSDPDLGPDLEIRYGGRHVLPGYYRRAKSWDLVVLYRGVLVAAIEFKSQVGSIGNNHNNRTEEALGNSVDLWRAHEDEFFGVVKPWLGFVMLLEKSEESTRVVGGDPALFPVDPAYEQVSYLDRYRVTFRRMLAEGKYDAVVVAASERGQGVYDEPDVRLSFATFEAQIAGRLALIKALPADAFPV